MKVKGPGSPLSSGAEPLEPLDPRELQKSVVGDKFAAALSQLEAQAGAAPTEDAGGSANAASSATRNSLAQIAAGKDLASSEGAATAVRESARFMVRSRLSEKFRDTEQGERVITDLGEYVANDPLLKAKLLAILQRIQAG